ncbi:MAG TPA: hypothetical protein VG871_01250 [Vicinamibacterales bacterium]|nr:hypothetical protein [Vicinamibacterales bacterium]
MRDDDLDGIDATIVPLPGDEPDEERERIRASNDHDQELEREGKVAPHNAGYDRAADGRPRRVRPPHVSEER